MDSMNMFPLAAGFLFPDRPPVMNNGRGHENTAYGILRDDGVDIREVSYPEGVVQERYSAIIIRYRWGEKLIYLPPVRPRTAEGCLYFQKAVEFYKEHEFQIINLNHISLDVDDFVVEDFIGEEYEQLRIFTTCINYTNTIICDSKGNYMYNPERIGD